jgi:hypothetical protein
MTKSRTDNDEPSLDMPYMLKDEPSFAKLRTLKADPK